MYLDDILAARHSVRAYSGSPIPKADIVAMLEAARSAPSACNSQTWRFVVVTDPDLRARICAEGMRPVVRNKFLRDAPCIIVGCSKLDIISNRIGTGITGIEYYQIDMGIALEHLVLKATDLGLGTCWIGWFKEDRVKELLNIPENVRVLALMAMGYPSEKKVAKRSRKALHKIAYDNRWGTSLT